MKKRIIQLAAISLAGMMLNANAATVTVTVADDGVSNIGAPNTFYWAITNASPGDTIAFNIPGAGPHYLQIPSLGFPLIYRKSNLMIDGYTQPGSQVNTNPITASNTAILKIVIDGRNGNARDMQYKNYTGNVDASDPPIDNSYMATEQAGYTAITESALLGVYRSTNVTIRGLAFLGSFDGPNGDVQKGICFAHDYDGNTTIVPNSTTNYGFYASGSDAYGHVNGCWFGVDPTNQTIAGVAGFRIAVTGYRHRDTSGGTLGVDRRPELPNIGMTVGVKRGSANPRAQFNVAAGLEQFVSFEPVRMTIAGNFIGVMPDGVTGYNYLQDSPSPATYRGSPVDLGRYDDTQPIVIGTDGDGVNDADEGNLFGPLQLLPNSTPNTQMGIYGTARKPYIIAGNRYGIANDGTRWTNSIFALMSPRLNEGTQVRFGSDFNGVSDALEANHVYNINVFADQFPNIIAPWSLIQRNSSTSARDGWLSLRGNVLVNNFPNYNPAGTSGNAQAPSYMASWSNYVAYPTGSPTEPGTTIPTLTASTLTTLNGSCGISTNGYTNLIVDVYLPDPEGQANGAQFGYEVFGAPAGGTPGGWGFVQGKTYLGSYLDNGPYDSNPAVGAFALNIASLGLTSGTKVTVAVTYSTFARPVLAAPVLSGGNVTLSWSGDNGGPYTTTATTAGGPSSGFGVQSASNINGPWTTTFAANNSITLAAGSAGYYRIIAPLAGMTTLCAPPVTLP